MHIVATREKGSSLVALVEQAFIAHLTVGDSAAVEMLASALDSSGTRMCSQGVDYSNRD